MPSKLPVPNGASCGCVEPLRRRRGIGGGRRGGGCGDGTCAARQVQSANAARPRGRAAGRGPGSVGTCGRRAGALGPGVGHAGGDRTPTSVGRRAAGGGGSGRASGGGVSLMSCRSARASASIGLGVEQLGRPRLLEDVGRRLVGDRPVVVLEEQSSAATGLTSSLSKIWVSSSSSSQPMSGLAPTPALAAAPWPAAWRPCALAAAAPPPAPAGRGSPATAARRDTSALADRRRDLPELLELRVLLLDLHREGLLHPRREILARVELADRVQERLQLVVQLDGVLVAILAVLAPAPSARSARAPPGSSGCTTTAA